jgi:hypothetical protein
MGDAGGIRPKMTPDLSTKIPKVCIPLCQEDFVPPASKQIMEREMLYLPLLDPRSQFGKFKRPGC